MVNSLGIGFRLKARVVINPDQRWVRNTRNAVMGVGMLAIGAGVALLAARGLHLAAFHGLGSAWGGVIAGGGGALLLGSLIHRSRRMLSDYKYLHKNEGTTEGMLQNIQATKGGIIRNPDANKDYFLKIITASKGILVVADGRSRTVQVVTSREWESHRIRLEKDDFYPTVSAVNEVDREPFVRPGSRKSVAHAKKLSEHDHVSRDWTIN